MHWSILTFWGLALIPTVTFVGYPLFVRYHRSRLTSVQPGEGTEQELPRAALIIAAYNEQRVIGRRIENALAQAYPEGRLRIYVTSDGSTDATEQRVLAFAESGVRLVSSPVNRGKTEALNDAIASARQDGAELLIFSDANSMMMPNAVTQLARWFRNPKVGCVCGRLEYQADADQPQVEDAVRSEQRYWAVDTLLKTGEGQSGCLLGGNGAILALRASLAIPLPAALPNDMVYPIWARRCGYAAVFEPNAVATESPAGSIEKEYERRVRIITRGLSGCLCCFRFLAWGGSPYPSRVYLAAQLAAKKLCRYLAAPSLLAMVACGAFAPGGLTLCAARLVAIAIALAGAAAGIHMVTRRKIPAIPDTRYPLAMAAASIVALFKFVGGFRYETWSPVRDDSKQS